MIDGTALMALAQACGLYQWRRDQCPQAQLVAECGNHIAICREPTLELDDPMPNIEAEANLIAACHPEAMHALGVELVANRRDLDLVWSLVELLVEDLASAHPSAQHRLARVLQSCTSEQATIVRTLAQPRLEGATT